MDTGQIYSALEAELTAFSAGRSPAYLKDVLRDGCYVYGAGNYGRHILALLRAENIPCRGVIDRKFDAVAADIDGVPALNPAALQGRDLSDTSLLIGMHNQTVLPGEIVKFGRAHAFREILWNADLPDSLGPAAGNYWLGSREFTLAHFSEINATARMLADDESRAVLAALIRYRITGDATAYPPADITQQYLPDGVFDFNAPICFVDGGAYTGDTYSYLLSRGVAIKNWIAFEPDPQNFVALTRFAATQSIPSTLFPCGLGEEFQQLTFAADEGTASHLGSGSMTVPCVAFDEVVHGPDPDYIKLDIEGAERAALRGMRQTIARARPHLAVSAYHRPEDLWVLSHTLAELAPGAKLYLRQHAKNNFETVLYAVPAG